MSCHRRVVLRMSVPMVFASGVRKRWNKICEQGGRKGVRVVASMFRGRYFVDGRGNEDWNLD